MTESLSVVRSRRAHSTVAVASLDGDRPLIVIAALTFIASSAFTIYGCEGMGAGMPMRGGWTMSMAWMRMPDQSWLAACSTFFAMWISMMTAMMAPVLAIALLKFRRLYAHTNSHGLDALTAALAGGYLLVWAVLGLALFPVGIAIARALMVTPALARWVPAASTVILLLAGYFQLTQWKAKSLCRCRSVLFDRPTPALRIVDSLRTGVVISKDCLVCCSGLMVVLILTGVMNLVGMVVVATAITAERLHRKSRPIARVIGYGIIVFALRQGYVTWQHW